MPTHNVFDVKHNVESSMLFGFEYDWYLCQRSFLRVLIDAGRIAQPEFTDLPTFGNFRLHEVTSRRQIIDFVDALVVSLNLIRAASANDANLAARQTLADIMTELQSSRNPCFVFHLR